MNSAETTSGSGFQAFVLDQLEGLPYLTCKPMFGGHGLYQGSLIFGIIFRGRLYFKVNASTVNVYREHMMGPFKPTPKQTLHSFYEVPIEIIEDRDVLKDWALTAIQCAYSV